MDKNMETTMVIGVRLGLYWDNGKNGMENQMETTIATGVILGLLMTLIILILSA